MLSVSPQESETGFELKKRVSWKGVFVREYNCTLGDHPLCSDSLPLSLDWSYSEDVKVKNIESSRERQSSYTFPKRLSYEDRKRRLTGDDDSADEQHQFAKPVVLVDSQPQQPVENEDMDASDGSQGVIYCRHVIDEEDEDDATDDDSVNYFLDWSKFAGFS